MADTSPDLVGGRYRVLGSLGRGAMGMVFMAHDPVLDRKVAIKQMTAEIAQNEELRQRFYVEARAAARLNHPNIITIHELHEAGGDIFIVMEMLEGRSLAAMIQAKPVPLSLEATLDVVAQVCDGLDYAHQRAIVHRDIKPANLFLTPGGTAKILDFGIARLGSLHMTAAGALIGTPDYMSPEQVRGDQIDRRTDLWAVGAVLYQLLSGSKPFEGKPLARLLGAIAQTPHVPLVQRAPSVPNGVSDLVDRLLAKPRDARPTSAAIVRDELRAILGRDSVRPTKAAFTDDEYGETIFSQPSASAPAAPSASVAAATPAAPPVVSPPPMPPPAPVAPVAAPPTLPSAEKTVATVPPGGHMAATQPGSPPPIPVAPPGAPPAPVVPPMPHASVPGAPPGAASPQAPTPRATPPPVPATGSAASASSAVEARPPVASAPQAQVPAPLVQPPSVAAAAPQAKVAQTAAAAQPGPSGRSRLGLVLVAVIALGVLGVVAVGGIGWWYLNSKGLTVGGWLMSLAGGDAPPASTAQGQPAAVPPATPTTPAGSEAQNQAATPVDQPVQQADAAAAATGGQTPPVEAQPPTVPLAAPVATPPAAHAPADAGRAQVPPRPAAQPMPPRGAAGRGIESGVSTTSPGRERLSQDTLNAFSGRQAGQGYESSQTASTVAAVNRINYVLEQYVQALVNGDEAAFRETRPSPSAEESGWLHARQLKVRLDDVRVDVRGTEASARCRRTLAGVSGTGAALRDERAVVFVLVRRQSGWVITDVR